MSDSLKKAFWAALIAVGVLIAASLTYFFPNGDPSALPSPVPSASASPSPSPLPSVSPSPTIASTQVLTTWKRPEEAVAAEWGTSVTKTVLQGQVANVILTSQTPCSLTAVSGIQKMLPTVTKTASAPSYPLGTFYDKLVPLTSANCSDAKFLQLDVTSSINVGGAQINIVVKQTKAPTAPMVQLNVEFNNYTALLGYCGGVYCNAESAGLQGTTLLNAHRISPYKSWPGGSISWQQYQGAFNLGQWSYLGFGDVAQSSAALAAVPVGTKSYTYIVDEPTTDSAILSPLQGWNTARPDASRMVTTPMKHVDFNQANSTYGKLIPWTSAVESLINIHCVVAENLGIETWKGSGDFYPQSSDYAAAGKTLWLYVSNMSNGVTSGVATGAPDLVVDRGAVESYGFFALALKYNVPALLYYNAIEGWNMTGIYAGYDVNATSYNSQMGGNGDGLLLYPDRANKIALPSIRLKLLRDASQWADVMLLAKAKDPTWFASTIGSIMTSPVSFDHNVENFHAAYTAAISRLP